MAKVLCTLPNMGAEIGVPSGATIKFTPHKPADGAHGMLSEDVSDEQAQELAGINGYALYVDPNAATADDLLDAAAAELEELRKRGIELGIAYADKMGAKRLRGEIAEAEKAAAAEKQAAADKEAADKKAADDAAQGTGPAA